MGLRYENLDPQTREYMLQEVERDLSTQSLYLSPRLNEDGMQNYAVLLKEAIQAHDDDWLARELRVRGYLKATERRKKPKGGWTAAKVPVTAPGILAEGEFNRFYVRGLCARAIEEVEVVVYRGKKVARPRAKSQAMLGKRLPARKLLEDLRQAHEVEPALGMPPGPNSGLTVRMPSGKRARRP